MKKRTIAVRAGAFCICLFMLLYGLTVLLKDKRVTFPYDTTRKIEGFYAEEKDSLDFVFVGSSQMFTSVVPAVLWQEYGITSYDFGANEQPMYLSYYYIREALKYQKPKAIVLEVSYCKGETYATEGVHHINLDDLRMGPTKIEAVFDVIPAGERLPYIFELAKYHDTWSKPEKAALQYIGADKHNPYKGYTPSTEGFSDGGVFREELAEIKETKPLPEFSLNYMKKIIELAKAEGVDLLFLKTPNDHAENQPYYNAVGELAAEHDIPYLNLNAEMAGQLHNHVYHAETITKRIGEWLTSLYETEDKRENPQYARWHEDAKYFYRYKELLELNDTAEFDDYIAKLTGKDYLVCLAVNDDVGSRMLPYRMELLEKFGVTVDLAAQGMEGESYLLVMEGDTIHAETHGRDTVAYENRLYGHRISVISQGGDAGKNASICFDGQEYALNGKGFNIVVYDPLQDVILSSRSFEIIDEDASAH